jgi:preprotein translocase subunit SecE
MVKQAVQFFTEVRTELRKVVWPTRQQTVKLTALVIGVSARLGLYLSLLDILATEFLKSVVRK